MDSANKDASDYTDAMHFGIDIREACRERRAGKGQWTYGFVRELLNRNHALTLFTDADIPIEWNDAITKRSDVRVVKNDSSGLRWHLETARDVKRNSEIDAYVATVSYIVPFIIGTSKRVIPVVHDLIAFMNEPHDKRATMIERLTLGRTMFHAHHVCTVSETTKIDLLKKFPSLGAAKVTPIFAASHSDNADAPKKTDIVLCVGTLCPRKNQLKLIQAYDELPSSLKKRHSLVLCGARGWHDDEIVSAAVKTEGVEWKRYVPQDELEDLYGRCAAFAFPSTYEGFGLPILEAMQRSIPVLTSNRGSMKEVAGDAALLVDPDDVGSIRDGLEGLLTDETLRARLSTDGPKNASRFSWPKTVDLFLNAVAH